MCIWHNFIHSHVRLMSITEVIQLNLIPLMKTKQIEWQKLMRLVLPGIKRYILCTYVVLILKGIRYEQFLRFMKMNIWMYQTICTADDYQTKFLYNKYYICYVQEIKVSTPSCLNNLYMHTKWSCVVFCCSEC